MTFEELGILYNGFFAECIVDQKILPSDKTYEEQEHDVCLFITHFKSLLKNHNVNITTPKYFHILFERGHVGANITGLAHIPIGVLLLLWNC